VWSSQINVADAIIEASKKVCERVNQSKIQHKDTEEAEVRKKIRASDKTLAENPRWRKTLPFRAMQKTTTFLWFNGNASRLLCAVAAAIYRGINAQGCRSCGHDCPRSK
jgi:hypothetical protein